MNGRAAARAGAGRGGRGRSSRGTRAGARAPAAPAPASTRRVKPAASRRASVSARAGVVPRRLAVAEVLGVGSRASTSRALARSSSMLPSPPHCATSWPPGRSAACRRANSRSWSAIQWKVAVERTASTGSCSSSSAGRRASPRHVRIAAQPLAGGCDHRLRTRPRRSPARGQALHQRLGDAPRAAAGVEHRLVSAQLQPGEHPAPSASSGPRCGRSSARPIGTSGIRAYVITYTSGNCVYTMVIRSSRENAPGGGRR